MDIFLLWDKQEARSPWCPCGLPCNGWIAALQLKFFFTGLDEDCFIIRAR